MTRAYRAAVFVCAFALSISAAYAKPRHKIARHVPQESGQCVADNNGRTTCQGAVSRSGGRARVSAGYEGGTVVGGRPAGCPRAFCGCEASLYLFGKIYPDLNLAANWLRKFPRTSPAPGMAAARRGHVFVLISHVGGNEWLVHDGNSGRHLTRQHVRSIAGYGIVNPHSRLAMR